MARVLVTGGVGYIGMMLAGELLDGGRDVTVLDVLLHGQDERARELQERGVRVVEGDIRDPEKRREALADAQAVVHLAAIVGDPACARDPELAREVNVDAAKAIAAEAGEAGGARLVMGPPFSNHRPLARPPPPTHERGAPGPLRPPPAQKAG